MCLDLPLYANLLTLNQHCQQLVNDCLVQANAQHIHHDYKVGNSILKKAILSLLDKLQPYFTGPFRIVTVHTNGTVTICLSDSTAECINIHWIKT